MMDKMNATTDFEERGELLLEIEEYLVQYGPFITLNWSGDCGLMNKNLKDFYIRETGAAYNYVFASVG
jgi:ABC-type transport system substrate-binding protein